MKRRQFLKLSLVGGVLAGFGGGCMGLLVGKNGDEELSIDFALKTLDKFSNTTIVHLGQWNPYQILTHCAQSVEYSMSGYPEHDSDLFKNTVGTLVFSFFSPRKNVSWVNGSCSGSASYRNQRRFNKCVGSIRESLDGFSRLPREVRTTFSYGQLTKEEFTIAHVIHLNNHLEELTV